MNRKTGYLANILSVPPLIFRFQFNPEMVSEKKSFKYDSANTFGKWGFDQTSAANGVIDSVGGFATDVKEFGSLLTAVKPLEPMEGDARTFELEFKLDASRPGPVDGDSHYDASIAPDLALLRSFTVPAWSVIDVASMIFGRKWQCFSAPPTCTLNYGGISAECVMTDLTIKLVAFKDNGDPLRADVSCTLKEQSFSVSAVADTVLRLGLVGVSNARAGAATDYKVNLPAIGGALEGGA